jgi:hypothetical protein
MATNLFSPAAVKLFDMAQRVGINSAVMISRRRRNFSEIPAKDSGAVGWSQEIARGKALRRAPSREASEQVRRTTNNNEIANGGRLGCITDSRYGCLRYH